MSDQALSGVPAKSSKGFKRVLKSLDMTLFTVCAILVIDQLAASASIGAQSIFWWIFTLVFFFIPYGLITAELGSTYPEQGGIYSWVQRAFGGRWSTSSSRAFSRSSSCPTSASGRRSASPSC
jgi:amino acid transporter